MLLLRERPRADLLRVRLERSADLVRDVVRSMTPEADKKSILLSVSPFGETAVADVDPVRMREVLTNIVSNALRHSKGGSSVIVSVSQTREHIAIGVQDSGEGMAPEEVARIFDRFYKGAASRGSGLGLAIAKSCADENHAGMLASPSRLKSRCSRGGSPHRVSSQ